MCEYPSGCIRDEKSGACPLCDKGGAGRIAEWHRDNDWITKSTDMLALASDFQKAERGHIRFDGLMHPIEPEGCGIIAEALIVAAHAMKPEAK